MKCVLKVQISLASNAGARQVLIYNKDRSFLKQAPLANFKGLDDVPKQFYEADIVSVVHDAIEIVIVFGKRLPDQGW